MRKVIGSSPISSTKKRKDPPIGWSFLFCLDNGLEPIYMQPAGGRLLPPVQTLVASFIFAFGKNAYRVLYRPVGLPGKLAAKDTDCHGPFDFAQGPRNDRGCLAAGTAVNAGPYFFSGQNIYRVLYRPQHTKCIYILLSSYRDTRPASQFGVQVFFVFCGYHKEEGSSSVTFTTSV